MKVVVAGGHGLVGTRLVWELTRRGHVVVSASRRTGIDTVTGAGLEPALAGADVLVDVTNAPSFDEPQVVEFFRRSTQNLVDAAVRAGIRHHLALSVVGTPHLVESAYFRAKAIQESILGRSPLPHTVARSTQFYEFMANIIPPGTGRDPVALSPALVQPVAAVDVAGILADLVEEGPSDPFVEIAGPELHRLCDLVQWVMYSFQDNRVVAEEANAGYYGAVLDNRILTPSGEARLGRIYFDDWLETYLGGVVRIPEVRHPSPVGVAPHGGRTAFSRTGPISEPSAVAPCARHPLPQ